MKRIDGQGPNALLQLREPVSKFPDFVRYLVQRLKILNPAMGKVKITETLCRAGLHLGGNDGWPDLEGRAILRTRGD
jgi:hypothetical protein